MRNARLLLNLLRQTGLSVLWLLVAVMTMGRYSAAQNNNFVTTTRTVKIPVRFARAADISNAMGGGMLVFGMSVGVTDITIPSPFTGSAANLLPDGIQSVTSFEPDNTLIVRYDTDDALRELKEIVRLLDVKPPTVSIRAVATVTLTDNAGHKQRLVLRSEGLTSGERRLHVKTSTESDPKRSGLLPVICTSDADLAARPFGDYSVNVVSDWYIDIAWHAPGSAKPIRLKNVYRTDVAVENGATITVTRATLKVPSGTAELVLQLTPRLAPGLSVSTTPSSTPTGKRRM